MHGIQRLHLSGVHPGLVACAQLLQRVAAAAAAQGFAEPVVATGSLQAGDRLGVEAASTASTASTGTAVAAAVQGKECSQGLRAVAGGSSGACDGVSGASGQKAGGGGNRRGGWRWNKWSRRESSGASAAAAAAAALAASAGSGVTLALAEAPSASLRDAQAAAEASLRSAWAEVEEEFARINARLPSHAPSLKGQQPSVGMVHGAVEVSVPIREGADTQAVLQEMRDGFGGHGLTAYSDSLFGTSRTVQLEVRPNPARPDSALRMQMFVPPPGGSEQAQVVVSKRSPFTESELAALGRLVKAANVTFSTDQPAQGDRARRHGLHGGADPDALQREMEALVEELARSAFGGFVAGPMRQMFEDLQRSMGPHGPHGRGGQGGFGPGGAGAADGDEDEEGEDGGSYGSFFPPQHGPGGGFPSPLPSGPAVAHRPKGRDGAAGHDWGSPAAARAVEQLLSMGAQVFPPGSKDKMDWGVLAGYEEQKRTIEDCLLLPLLRPDVYAKLARATRKTFANNRPRAVLFEGPPGTGKTTSARVISSQAAVPLIYLPLEAVLSKWYGQSEQQLGQVFKAAEALGGAIIFLDELDALGGNREGGLHEVSRRLLSVLLREMEGFDSETKRTVVIGATNRKTDLDPALLSRFDLVLTFGLPDEECRRLILRQYAQQLNDVELSQLAARTEGMSGRDLRDVCEHTERRWASKIIRGEVREEELPPLSEYLASADERATAVQRVQQQATAAGQLSRLLNGGGGGGDGRGLPSWLGGWR